MTLLKCLYALQVLHPVLKSHSVANPDVADLFYIPIYTAQLYHSLLLTQEKGHAGSLNETATSVARALQWIKTEFPFWNRTNGLVSNNDIIPAGMGNLFATATSLVYPAKTQPQLL